MPGVFSVPERRLFSCPPPICLGAKRTPFFTTSAPIPLGAWILWPLSVYISACFIENGTRRKPCTPSTCRSARPAIKRWRRSTSRIAPVSLLTCMQLTSDAPSSSALSISSQRSSPVSVTPTTRTSCPCARSASNDSRTDGCSTAETATTCGPRILATEPRMARLFASVPPEVKIKSQSSPCTALSTASRQARTSRKASTAGR